MIDRRKTIREGVKRLDIKSSKVSKIIFYKQILLPILVSLISILALFYVLIKDFLTIHSLNNNFSNISEQIRTLKEKEENLKKQNHQITSKLAHSNSYMIDTQEVTILIQKIIHLLKLKQIITNANIISVENDSIYQNVANISIQVQTSSKFLDTNLVKDILKLVLKKVVYLKDISIKNNNINIQIYKKVKNEKV